MEKVKLFHSATIVAVDEEKAGVFCPELKKFFEIDHRYNGGRYLLPKDKTDSNNHPIKGEEYRIVVLTDEKGDERAFFDYHYYPKPAKSSSIKLLGKIDTIGEPTSEGSLQEYITPEGSRSEWKASFFDKPEIAQQLSAIGNSTKQNENDLYGYLYVGIKEVKTQIGKKPIVVGLRADLEKAGSIDALEAQLRNHAGQALNDKIFVSMLVYEWHNKKNWDKTYCKIRIPVDYPRPLFYHGCELHTKNGNTMVQLKNEEIVQFILDKTRRHRNV